MKKFFLDLCDNYQNREDFKIQTMKNDEFDIHFLFLQGMTDVKFFIGYLLPFINKETIPNLHKKIPTYCNPITILTTDNIDYLLSVGNLITVIEIDNLLYYYHFPLSTIPKRSPSESHLDPSNLFQPRDGLVEDIKDNVLLIKRRLKTNKLKIQKFLLGSLSLTDVYVFYLDGIDKKEYFQNIIKKLEEANIKTCSNINTVSKLFEDKGLVPLTNASGNTEYLVENILKGKVVIMVDGSPVALILPSLFTNFTTSKDEIETPRYFSIFKRIHIIISLFFSISFLGLFVAVVNYHSSLLSLKIIAMIKLTEKGTILPMFVEIIIILFCFELYNLSISRSPSGYVQNIVVLFGGIIVGQNIVQSGIVGPFVLLVSSLCYIAGYSVTNNPRFITSLAIFRLIVLISSLFFGIIGFFLSTILIIYYLYNKKSIGIPYLSPFMPTNIKKTLKYFKPELNQWKKSL